MEPKIVPVNENLKAYIEIMKTNFPGIAVGISIGGIDLDGFTNSPDKASEYLLLYCLLLKIKYSVEYFK